MGVAHKGNFFSEAQSLITASGVTLNAASTNVLNLVADNMGEGNPVDVVIELPDAVVGGVAPTLVIKLESDSVEGMGTKRTELQTRTFTAAELVKGRLVKFGVPTPIKKFVQLYYTLVPGAAAITAGKVTAYLERREV